MNPGHQSSHREKLRKRVENVETGDAPLDSLLQKEVARRETFAAPERARRQGFTPPKLTRETAAQLRQLERAAERGIKARKTRRKT